MAFLVKYILIILLRVDIQGIIMLRREEMKEVYSGWPLDLEPESWKINKEGLVDGLRWKCTLHPEWRLLFRLSLIPRFLPLQKNGRGGAWVWGYLDYIAVFTGCANSTTICFCKRPCFALLPWRKLWMDHNTSAGLVEGSTGDRELMKFYILQCMLPLVIKGLLQEALGEWEYRKR